jgi:hypothetical protein
MLRLIALPLILMLTAAVWAADGDPVAYWRFDSAGPRIADLAGQGHTATLTGGQVITEAGRTFLRLDGKTRIEVASAPDLCLRDGFTMEARVRPTDLSDGRLIAFKDQEYLLRVDWPVESSQLSFFVHLADGWESRASAFKPPLNAWHHLVATWDHGNLSLWLNGLPHGATHRGDPRATNAPLLIGSNAGFGKGFVGDIEYVKVYPRALTSSEILKAAYSAGQQSSAPVSDATAFDFRQDLHHWAGREGATVAASAESMVLRTPSPSALAMRDNLTANVDRSDYLVLRLAVNRGSRAQVVFITSRGAAQIPFATLADGKLHTYILEPWQYTGWGGKLLALGLVPAEVGGAEARLRYLRVTAEPEGEGEVELQSLFTQSVLPRAGRDEQMVLRLRNTGGPLRDLKVTLRAPAGVTVAGPTTQTISALGYLEQREITWRVRAAKPLAGSFRVTATAPDIAPGRLAGEVTFQPALALSPAGYVPEPVPATSGKYEVWTHYCPLWKQGTHTGWKAIEPYPERKPVLGWYNEGTPEVADWHIKYWLEHGITGVIYCWYRSSINEPVKQSLGHAIHDGLLKAKYLSRIKFGIMWENGCGAGVGSAEDLMTNVFPYWLDNYFTNPSYLKMDGKPVLYVWVPGNVTQHLGGSAKVKATFDLMRQKCRERGLKGLYIVGCQGGVNREALEQMAREGWDASSAYGSGWTTPADMKTVGSFTCAPVEGFVTQQEAIWKGKDAVGVLPDITAAMMGWDSRPWNETSFFWSENTPEKFRDLCRRAKAAMDAKPTTGPEKRSIIFCCWNEFGEGHYIEPTRGYGFSYLDVIREEFTDAPKQHTDLAPEDVGLGPYDSWYQQAKAATPAGDGSRRTAWRGQNLGAWSGFMGIEKSAVKGGVLQFGTSTADPALSSPTLKVRLSKFSQVVVEMRVSRPGGAQLFWTTASSPRTEERASAHVQTVADGQFHSYAFEVGKNEDWGGCLLGMRLDPTDQAGVNVEIRGIELR